MATTNYNLPTITGNMNADVVRDMNALAEATDTAIKTAVDGVDLSAVEGDIADVGAGLAAHLADGTSHVPYAITTGTANAYAITLDPAPTTLVDGLAITVKINVQNTGASTLNVNSLGAKPIKKSNGNDVSSGNLKAGIPYTLRYNGTNFILQGEGGGVWNSNRP